VEPLTIGRRLGPFQIEAQLGAGGMGTVYLAHDRQLLRHVAIKILDHARSRASEGRSLLHEARAAAALNHPSICGVHRIGRTRDEWFIVMEHVEGAPLSAVIPEEKGLPLETALHYAMQIGDAVAHAHRRGIAHGDLTSANIMITPDGIAKVLDFGLAVSKLTAAPAGNARTTRPADLMSRAGTVPYMAPERLRGRPADARSDIWALGVLLYEMVAGRRPFTGGTVYEVAAAILSGRYNPAPSCVPAAVRTLIDGCLTERARRLASVTDLASALDDL
jgi:serine/threonine protein kinase